MSGQRFLAAFAGVVSLFIAFGCGIYLAHMPILAEPKFPTYKDQRPANSIRVRSPCDDAIGPKDSELCAQWRAAVAAESSAFWTQLGFWVGLGGFIGLLTTLHFSRSATAAAAQATREAVKANDLTLMSKRPWLKLTVQPTATLRVAWKNEVPSYFLINLSATIKNMGESPALTPVVSVVLTQRDGGWSNIQIDRLLRQRAQDSLARATLLPGDEVSLGDGISYGAPPLSMSTGDVIELYKYSDLLVLIGVFYAGAGYDQMFRTSQVFIAGPIDEGSDDSRVIDSTSIRLHHLFPSEIVE